jgi:hypothetical protein
VTAEGSGFIRSGSDDTAGAVMPNQDWLAAQFWMVQLLVGGEERVLSTCRIERSASTAAVYFIVARSD